MIQIDEPRFRWEIHAKTQRVVAKEMGISQSAFWKKIQNLERLRISELNQISQILGKPASEFLIIDYSEIRNGLLRRNLTSD